MLGVWSLFVLCQRVESVLWLGDGWYSNDIIMISWWSITCLILALLLRTAINDLCLSGLPPRAQRLQQVTQNSVFVFSLSVSCCQSVIICSLLVTVDDASVGGGAGGWAECRVMMYWCHLSSFFTQAWYITSHPSTAQHSSARPYSDQAKLNDTRILRGSGYSERSCVMSSFSTMSPRDTIENIRHFLSDETRLILSAPTFYKHTTHSSCWKCELCLNRRNNDFLNWSMWWVVYNVNIDRVSQKKCENVQKIKK